MSVENKPFIAAFQELNSNFLSLIGSMSVLRALSGIQAEGQSERNLLDSALQVLMLYQDLERCSIYLLKGERLVNAAGLDWEDLIGIEPSKEPSPREFRLGVGVIGLAAKSGRIQHCQECAKDSRFVAMDGEAVFGQGLVNSLISVPIKASGDVIGVLNVSHPHRAFFCEGHERTLQVFCNFLGQLIANNRLLGEMEQRVSERTQLLEQALSEAEALKLRYAELSFIDELSGLHNRRYFFPEARAALSRAARYGSSFSLMLLDIDHFKRINDTHGHAVGDEVLRQVANLLRDECREGDILARFGGEEFIVALPNTDLEGAKVLAERVRCAVKAGQWEFDNKTISLTASIGVASLVRAEAVESDALLDRLIREADQALYLGKDDGRDQCRAYQEIACLD